MTVAVPIERFAGDVVGVLVAEVNLKYIWEVVSRIKVGQAGYAYVVSREGDLIAHPDISLVLQKRQVKQLSQVQTALAGAPMRFVAQPNLAGQQVFAAFARFPNWDGPCCSSARPRRRMRRCTPPSSGPAFCC